MNVVETSKTMQGVKAMQNEINAWEGRLVVIRGEVESHTKQRDQIKTEIDEIRVRSNQEVEKKYMASRKAASDVEEARKKLEADRAEFQGILQIHQKEKNALERAKQEALDTKNNAQKSLDQVGVFIRMVRDGAAKL